MPLTIGLVMLLVWNLYLALQNKTTIEFHEGVTANIKAISRASDCLENSQYVAVLLRCAKPRLLVLNPQTRPFLRRWLCFTPGLCQGPRRF